MTESSVMSSVFKGRPGGSIVIFGGGSGIGLATAALARARGCSVVVADANPAAAGVLASHAPGSAFVQCDATDEAEVTGVLRDAADRQGGLGAVVTTVGGAFVHKTLALDLAYWEREIRFNLTSAYLVAFAAVEIMRKAGAGSIITTSSSFANVPAPDRIGYSAAKAGVIGLTKSLAMAVAREGVRVNCVAPGATDTERVRRMTGSAEDLARINAAAPQGRIAQPVDVAEAILFLASDAATSITGQVIYVTNGSYMP